MRNTTTKDTKEEALTVVLAPLKVRVDGIGRRIAAVATHCCAVQRKENKKEKGKKRKKGKKKKKEKGKRKKNKKCIQKESFFISLCFFNLNKGFGVHI